MNQYLKGQFAVTETFYHCITTKYNTLIHKISKRSVPVARTDAHPPGSPQSRFRSSDPAAFFKFRGDLS